MQLPEDLSSETLIAILDTIYNPETTHHVYVSSQADLQLVRTALGYLSVVVPEAAHVQVTLGTIH